jgi:hypothetical protein
MSITRSSLYEVGQVYRGGITDQVLARSARDEVQLILTVSLTGKLKNEKDPGEGTEPCPLTEREVRITFIDDDGQRLRMAVRDLERLGYDDDDVSRLAPDHPRCFGLLNRQVHVRMRVVQNAEYWNLAWPREVLRGDELKGAAASLQSRIEALKQKKGAKTQDK